MKTAAEAAGRALSGLPWTLRDLIAYFLLGAFVIVVGSLSLSSPRAILEFLEGHSGSVAAIVLISAYPVGFLAAEMGSWIASRLRYCEWKPEGVGKESMAHLDHLLRSEVLPDTEPAKATTDQDTSEERWWLAEIVLALAGDKLGYAASGIQRQYFVRRFVCGLLGLSIIGIVGLGYAFVVRLTEGPWLPYAMGTAMSGVSFFLLLWSAKEAQAGVCECVLHSAVAGVLLIRKWAGNED